MHTTGQSWESIRKDFVFPNAPEINTPELAVQRRDEGVKGFEESVTSRPCYTAGPVRPGAFSALWLLEMT